MFYLKKPADFISQKDVVICYLIHNDEILLVRRNDDKFRGGTWTAPGGKKEDNESLQKAVVREIFEETNISLDPNNLISVNNCFIKHDHFHFNMNIFKYYLNEKPIVTLNINENDQYTWSKIEKAQEFNLIEHGFDCLKLTFP